MLPLKDLKKLNTEKYKTKALMTASDAARRNCCGQSIRETFFLKAHIPCRICQPSAASPSSPGNTSFRHSHPSLNFYSRHHPYCACSLHQNADKIFFAFLNRMLQLSFRSQLEMLMNEASWAHFVWESPLYTGLHKQRLIVFKIRTHIQYFKK